MKRLPEEGIQAFMDYPRYTSGYASLYNTIAFTVETHMFKPFEDRVLSTWHLLREMLRFCSTHQDQIREAKRQAWDEKIGRSAFTLQWSLDTSRYQMIPFRGYRAKTKTGSVTHHPQLYYDRNDPWEKEIQQVQLHAGDYIFPVRQPAIEYLVQTLEPQGYDSFFSWNFFDEVLFRNEYFSPYIFEETEEKLLRDDAELKRDFEQKRSRDSLFFSNPYMQLRFIL